MPDWDQIFTIGVKISEQVVSQVTDIVAERVIERTPVGNPALWKSVAPIGYIPGTLKKAWRKRYSKSTNRGRIENLEAYAERVEFGWSTQAPAGMARVTVAEIPDIIKGL